MLDPEATIPAIQPRRHVDLVGLDAPSILTDCLPPEDEHESLQSLEDGHVTPLSKSQLRPELCKPRNRRISMNHSLRLSLE